MDVSQTEKWNDRGIPVVATATLLKVSTSYSTFFVHEKVRIAPTYGPYPSGGPQCLRHHAGDGRPAAAGLVDVALLLQDHLPIDCNRGETSGKVQSLYGLTYDQICSLYVLIVQILIISENVT